MSEETAGYGPLVLDHLRHPRNMGEMEDASGVGEAVNPVCGDTLRLFIKVETDRIVGASFLTFGCAAAIAASSMTTLMVQGKTLDEAWSISNEAVSEALGGLPPSKVHCSFLAEKAIRAAISDYRKKSSEKHRE